MKEEEKRKKKGNFFAFFYVYNKITKSIVTNTM